MFVRSGYPETDMQTLLRQLNTLKNKNIFMDVTDLYSSSGRYNINVEGYQINSKGDLPDDYDLKYIVDDINVYSERQDKIKLLFQLVYPNYTNESLDFALKYDDYDYILELTQIAINKQNYGFLTKILSEDLPKSVYKQAYIQAGNDQIAKDIVWKQIAPRELLISEISKSNITSDISKVIKRF